MIKEISKTATVIFAAAIARIPAGETSAVIGTKGGAIMPLHVERIGANTFGSLYSFAHYYEQNGDLMRDPDVVMLQTANGYLFPISYRQDGCGIDNEYVIFDADNKGYRIAKKEQADLVSFCGTWARNLKEQQGL
jgi:hypothetical protein